MDARLGSAVCLIISIVIIVIWVISMPMSTLYIGAVSCSGKENGIGVFEASVYPAPACTDMSKAPSEMISDKVDSLPPDGSVGTVDGQTVEVGDMKSMCDGLDMMWMVLVISFIAGLVLTLLAALANCAVIVYPCALGLRGCMHALASTAFMVTVGIAAGVFFSMMCDTNPVKVGSFAGHIFDPEGMAFGMQFILIIVMIVLHYLCICISGISNDKGQPGRTRQRNDSPRRNDQSPQRAERHEPWHEHAAPGHWGTGAAPARAAPAPLAPAAHAPAVVMAPLPMAPLPASPLRPQPIPHLVTTVQPNSPLYPLSRCGTSSVWDGSFGHRSSRPGSYTQSTRGSQYDSPRYTSGGSCAPPRRVSRHHPTSPRSKRLSAEEHIHLHY